MANQPTRRLSGWVARLVASLIQQGWPLVLLETFNWIFNYPFCTFTLWYFGPITGACIISVLALGINAFIFWLYEYLKVDWLKANAVRMLANKENKTRLERILTWHLTPRDTLLKKIVAEFQFGLLLSQIDPVIVAVHYREHHFEGISRADWVLLFKATLYGVLIWLLILEPTVLGLKSLWSH